MEEKLQQATDQSQEQKGTIAKAMDTYKNLVTARAVSLAKETPNVIEKAAAVMVNWEQMGHSSTTFGLTDAAIAASDDKDKELLRSLRSAMSSPTKMGKSDAYETIKDYIKKETFENALPANGERKATKIADAKAKQFEEGVKSIAEGKPVEPGYMLQNSQQAIKAQVKLSEQIQKLDGNLIGTMVNMEQSLQKASNLIKNLTGTMSKVAQNNNEIIKTSNNMLRVTEGMPKEIRSEVERISKLATASNAEMGKFANLDKNLNNAINKQSVQDTKADQSKGMKM